MNFAFLYQGEKQPNTAPRSDEVDCMKHWHSKNGSEHGRNA